MTEPKKTKLDLLFQSQHDQWHEHLVQMCSRIGSEANYAVIEHIRHLAQKAHEAGDAKTLAAMRFAELGFTNVMLTVHERLKETRNDEQKPE